MLFDCASGSELVFDRVNDLCDYCDKNGVNLGVWYYGKTPEETVFDSGEYSISSTPRNCSVVRRGKTELFTGDIDKYAVFGDYLAFHIRAVEEKTNFGMENPILEYSEDNVIAKRFDGVSEGFSQIYSDNYAVINMTDGSYNIFEKDEKSEIKNIAEQCGEKLKWKKVK